METRANNTCVEQNGKTWNARVVHVEDALLAKSVSDGEWISTKKEWLTKETSNERSISAPVKRNFLFGQRRTIFVKLLKLARKFQNE